MQEKQQQLQTELQQKVDLIEGLNQSASTGLSSQRELQEKLKAESDKIASIEKQNWWAMAL